MISLQALICHRWVLLLSEGERRVCGELAGRIWFPATGGAAEQELLVERCLFTSVYVGENELYSSLLPAGDDGQLSLRDTRQQGSWWCRAAHNTCVEDDRLTSQC